ncbi:hypothetical protein mRhiFer1_006684 [Rhinolophus ferrumequinum]|uniref:Interferon lambda 4 n=1 Tax=Rhinolophus ferrumequinum TaxID=59479 RepID=A0A7J7SIC2_RHIFE|nr:hypothetical protein mRhiFer1_006684 [Rhinolophus ferrumequinum]
MGPNGATAVAVGLWFLVTVSVAAGPDVAAPRRCILSHYRSLDPRALAAVKALRDRYEEETLSWRPRNCSFRPRRDPPRPSWLCALRPTARPQDSRSGPAEPQTVQTRFASSQCPRIRGLVCVWEGRGRGGWETLSSACFVHLLSPLQLQLVRKT